MSSHHNFEPTVGTLGGGGEFRFQQNGAAQPPGMSTNPLVPLFPRLHQQMEMQYTLPSGATPQQQQITPPIPNPKITKASSDVCYSDIKPDDDRYRWNKSTQKKRVKSGVTRYYYCTDRNCPAKKYAVQSPDGQITYRYKGEHNHLPLPLPSKCRRNANPRGKSGFGSEGQFGNFGKEEGDRDQGSSQVTPEHISGLSDSEEVGNDETRLGGRDEDEPQSKRRFVEVQISKQASSRRTDPEPHVTSEVDILDDGYKWRKYDQKYLKYSPHIRMYYRCTEPGCDVRKQVQRVESDPKDVTTTYKGKHNHDVPASKNSSGRTNAK